MRILDIYLPKEQAVEIERLAEEAGYHHARFDGAELTHLRVAAPNGAPDALLEKLDREYGFEGDDPDGFFVMSEPLTIAPRDEDEAKKSAKRAAFEEIENAAEDGCVMDRTFWVFASCAAVLAGGGIILGSVPVVVGAMVIAPVFKPLTAMALGLATARPKVALLGFLAVATACGLAAAAGFLMAVATPFLAENASILARSELSLFNTIVAVGAGIAAGYSVIRNDRSALIGIVIAASLVPAAAAVGVGLGGGFQMLALNSALTLATNVVAVVVAIIGVFRFEQVRSSVWREVAEGKKIGDRTIVVGLGALLLLASPIAVLFTLQYRGAVVERRVDSALGSIDATETIVLGRTIDKEGGVVVVFAASAPSDATMSALRERLSRGGGGPRIEWRVLDSTVIGER